jgi:serine/threonine protein kinase
MELAGGGELFDGLCKLPHYTENDVAVYIRQVLWGLEHMHSKHVAHLGLTLGDILLSRPGGDDVKISDLGLARRFTSGHLSSLDYGMPEYVAPDSAHGEGVGMEADMWSVGIINYILMSGISPFRGETDMKTLENVQNYLMGKKPNRPEAYDLKYYKPDPDLFVPAPADLGPEESKQQIAKDAAGESREEKKARKKKEKEEELALLEAERAEIQEAFEKEKYNRILTQEIQAEQDLARTLIIKDQLNTLKDAYINNIYQRVVTQWRYQGAGHKHYNSNHLQRLDNATE